MDWVKQYGALVVVGVVGVGILLYGLWGQIMPGKVEVEIIKSGSQSSDHSPTSAQGSELGDGGQVVVDVAGAVERAGVYKLPSGSRIGDALVVAGGLSASADREWVAKTLNLAKEVKDQEKIYIPTINTGRETPSKSNGEGVTLGTTNSKININTASEGELDKLVGIGEVRAQAIVANRPYSNIEELVSKAKIPQSVYDKIKDSVSIY